MIRLATIDPQSQKDSEIYKNNNGLVLTEIQSFKYVKITKPGAASGWPCISL